MTALTVRTPETDGSELDTLTNETPETDGSELDTLTNEQLVEVVRSGLRITAEQIQKTATAVTILHRRGYDLNALGVKMLDELKAIGCGQLLAEVFVRYFGKLMLLKAISRLSIPDQERFAVGEPVRLLVFNEKGERDFLMVDPANLQAAQIRQVFDYRNIRNDAAQVAYLEAERSKARKAVPTSIGVLRLDPEAKGFWVGRKFISLTDAEKAVRELKRVQ
jgi:hypothetical protein